MQFTHLFQKHFEHFHFLFSKQHEKRKIVMLEIHRKIIIEWCSNIKKYIYHKWIIKYLTFCVSVYQHMEFSTWFWNAIMTLEFRYKYFPFSTHGKNMYINSGVIQAFQHFRNGSVMHRKGLKRKIWNLTIRLPNILPTLIHTFHINL